MNSGTEDMWRVINLTVMSGHAEKFLQEILRHELGVTAIPGCLHDGKQETARGSLFLRGG